MSRISPKYLAISLILLLTNAHAATYFVRSGASGNGTSWANAWGNVSSISWSALNPGDTVCVAGGTYSGSIATGKSGTSGNPITLLRARAADSICGSTTTGWNSAYDTQVKVGGINLQNDYVTIDGNQLSNGITMTQANSSGAGIGVAGPTNHITLSYLEVSGPCPSTGCNQNADTRGIDLTHWNGSTYDAQQNMLIQHANVHGECTLFIAYYNTSNLTVQNSRFADSMDETPGNPYCHPNVFEDGGIVNGVFRWNEVVNWEVEGIMTCPNGPCTTNMAIYGNIWHDPFNGCGVCRVLEVQGNANGPHLLYDNTFVNIANTVISTANGGSFSSASQGRNNIYWNAAGPGLPSDDYDYSSASLSESHGQGSATNPFVNSAARTVAGYNLNANTNAGLDLGSPYNVDYNGNTRTTWDRGIVQFAGTASAPAPPTALTAIIH
jgi:hypothetical protein